MIVDDNRALVASACTLLETQGMSVAGVATTTQEALPLVEDLRPDVVLVDIVLGPESGFDVVRRIAARRDGCCRSILISTHAEDDFADLIAASPAVGFLSKGELSATSIRRLLKRHSASR